MHNKTVVFKYLNLQSFSINTINLILFLNVFTAQKFKK